MVLCLKSITKRLISHSTTFCYSHRCRLQILTEYGLSFQFMANYQRRDPKNNPLHRLISEHYDGFVKDHPNYPDYVYKTFEAYMSCGDLYSGFMRTKCSDCDDEEVVAFSCKKRGFCSSCGSKRASESAIHLVDNILPYTKYRQIVVTLPFPLRFWCATNKKLLNKIYKIIQKALFRNMKERALRQGVKKPALGAITFIQNWGSALNLTPHYHVLLMESVYESIDEENPRIRNLNKWENIDIQEVMQEIVSKVIKYLIKKGYLNDQEEILENPLIDQLFEDHSDLTTSLQSSLQNRIAFGENAGRYVTKIGSGFGYYEEIGNFKSLLCLSQNGFTLHAGRVIKTQDRKGLEDLINYMARPSVSVNRLSITETQNVRYTLKNRWHDGTSAVEFTPMDFLSRLAALVPPPRTHMVKYAGIFAPNHPIRKKIILKPEVKKGFKPRLVEEDESERKKVKNTAWARLLARIFKIDIGTCRKCGGQMEIMSAVFDPFEVERYLKHVGIARSPPVKKAVNEFEPCYLPLEY